MPKAFEFAESFSKRANSNPSPLLADRFLGFAPRAFENCQEVILAGFEFGK
jgi:hypothetical protein